MAEKIFFPQIDPFDPRFHPSCTVCFRFTHHVFYINYLHAKKFFVHFRTANFHVYMSNRFNPDFFFYPNLRKWYSYKAHIDVYHSYLFVWKLFLNSKLGKFLEVFSMYESYIWCIIHTCLHEIRKIKKKVNYSILNVWKILSLYYSYIIIINSYTEEWIHTL